MKDKQLVCKRAIALLCVAFIFVYISVFYFAHAHTCFDADCALCTWIESARNALDALFALTLISALLLLSRRAVCAVAFDRLCRRRTLVHLKVKLSD